jgi:plastocyanin
VRSRFFVLLLVLGAGTFLPSPPASAAEHAVSIPSDSNTFSPKEVTVAVNDTVTWTDNSVAPHSITAENGAFDWPPGCSSSNTGACMKFNDKFSFTFRATGTYRYYCKIHGGPSGVGMSGVVTVQGTSPTVLPTTTAPTTTAAPTTTVPRTTTTVKATTTTSSTSTTSSTPTTTSSTTSTTSTTVPATTTTTTPSGGDGGGNGALAALLAALIVAVVAGGGFALYQMRPDGPGLARGRRPPPPL